MCIRDRLWGVWQAASVALDEQVEAHDVFNVIFGQAGFQGCLLYTSDAADERSSVDLGGRRIIKKKRQIIHTRKAQQL